VFFDAILPRIQIHCWGGLGSQLYAVVLRLELQARYPARKFEIVCHDNGVTQRESEISEFFPGSVISVQDYTHSDEFDGKVFASGGNRVKPHLKNLIVRVLRGLSIVLDGDQVTGFPKIRFWTIQVRGHYSERKLDESALLEVHNMIRNAPKNQPIDSKSHRLFVHYRLGDLLKLQDKSPISASRLLPVIQELHRRVGLEVELFSDSPDQAAELLAPRNFHINVVQNFNAINTLWALINSEYFIGTNSKISLWAVILNSQTSSRAESHLPYEIQHHVIANVGDLRNLTYY
jgi:hypothetical protein